MDYAILKTDPRFCDMEENDILEESIIYAETLFSYLYFHHPLYYDLPDLFHFQGKSDVFKEKVGKAVLCTWSSVHVSLQMELRYHFPSFIKNEAVFEKYLKQLFDGIDENSSQDKIIQFSAMLLEVISFLYRRGVTHYVYKAPYYWLLMFKCIYENFCLQGCWPSLDVEADIKLELYEETVHENTFHQFWYPRPESRRSKADEESESYPRREDLNLDQPLSGAEDAVRHSTSVISNGSNKNVSLEEQPIPKESESFPSEYSDESPLQVQTVSSEDMEKSLDLHGSRNEECSDERKSEITERKISPTRKHPVPEEKLEASPSSYLKKSAEGIKEVSDTTIGNAEVKKSSEIKEKEFGSNSEIAMEGTKELSSSIVQTSGETKTVGSVEQKDKRESKETEKEKESKK